MTTNPQDLDALVADLRDRGLTKAANTINTLRRVIAVAGVERRSQARRISMQRRELRELNIWHRAVTKAYEATNTERHDLRHQLAEATSALDAVKRAERAQALRDAAARAYEVAHNTNDISKIRDAILAMIPEATHD